MNKLFMAVFALAVFACSTGRCFAVLGETEAELEKRYGKPTREVFPPNLDPPAEKMLVYRNREDRGTVCVVIWQGRSASEIHFFWNADANPVAAADVPQKVAAVLDANAQGSSWKAQGEQPNGGVLQWWTREDSGAVANVMADTPEAVQVHERDFHLEVVKAALRAAK